VTEPKESADERRRRGLQTGRLESFSDGVFAIAVTLLVLDIAVPVHAGRDLVRPDADDEEIELLTKRLTPGLAGYLVLIIAGLFVPVVAVIGYRAVAPYFIIPFRHRTIVRIRRGRGRERDRERESRTRLRPRTNKE
jgi:hypothetical protein